MEAPVCTAGLSREGWAEAAHLWSLGTTHPPPARPHQAEARRLPSNERGSSLSISPNITAYDTSFLLLLSTAC